MNGKRIAEEIGKIRDEYVVEALETKRGLDGRERSITVKSKKRLIAILAAAVIIAAIGCGTAAAVKFGNLSIIKNQYEKTEDVLDVPEELPKMDIEENGLELTPPAPKAPAATDDGSQSEAEETEAPNPEELKPGEARFTGIVVTDHSFDGTFDLNVSGMGLPEKATDGAEYEYFESFTTVEEEIDGNRRFIGVCSTSFVSRDGDIATFVLSDCRLSTPPQGDLIFTVDGIKYQKADRSGEVSGYDGKIEVKISSDDYEVTESKYSLNAPESDGCAYLMELSPSAIKVSPQGGTSGEAFDVSTVKVEVKLRDGTVLSEDLGETGDKARIFVGGAQHMNGGFLLNFATLVDISEVSSVTVNGIEFDF